VRVLVVLVVLVALRCSLRMCEEAGRRYEYGQRVLKAGAELAAGSTSSERSSYMMLILMFGAPAAAATESLGALSAASPSRLARMAVHGPWICARPILRRASSSLTLAWPCSLSLPRVPPSATVTMSPPNEAPAPAPAPAPTLGAVPPSKEPTLDAGRRHHDHCVCPVSEGARDAIGS
jgi:hypothetical protein